MIDLQKTYRGTVQKLVFQGKGLVRLDNFVIFVPDVLPGEEIEFHLIEKKKSYGIGVVDQIVTAHPLRRKPVCPYFGRCGGCALQHAPYSEQLKFKTEWVEDALTHSLKDTLELKVAGADQEWSYRQRIVLHFEKDENLKIGYIARDNTTLLDITECPIFSEKPIPLFADLKNYLSQCEGRVSGSATVVKAENKYLLHIFFNEGKAAIPQLFDSWLGVTVKERGSIKEAGEQFYCTDYMGLKTKISASVFLQNYPEMASKLYRDVIGALDDKPTLDLYCGTGVLSLLVAKKAARVVGIEVSENSVRLAQENKRANGIENCDFFAGFVEEKLAKIQEKEGAKNWIINPPRQGLSQKVRELILSFLPEKIIYISCMPQTLGRDLVELQKKYKVVGSNMYDMFPQTTHVETMITLHRR